MVYVACLETHHIQAISDQRISAIPSLFLPGKPSLLPLLAAQGMGKWGPASCTPDKILEGTINTLEQH